MDCFVKHIYMDSNKLKSIASWWRDTLTLEEVPNTDRLKAGFFRLDWEGWGPLLVLSVSGDQSCGSEAVLDVGTSTGERVDLNRAHIWTSTIQDTFFDRSSRVSSFVCCFIFFFFKWMTLFYADNHKMQGKNSDCWVVFFMPFILFL